MATRLYLTSAAADISPAFTTSFWESTTGIVRVRGSLDRLNTTSATVSRAETSSTNARDTMLLQVVSDALPAAVTVDGTLTIRALVRESSLAANFISQVTARLVDSTGTHKADLYSGDTGTTNTSEWNTFNQARSFPRAALAPVTLASAPAAAGDRIVIEMGYRALNTSTTTFTGYLTYGDPSGSSDIPTDETSQAGVPWAEFSADLWTPPAPPPKTDTLTDDFTTQDTAKWSGWRTGLTVVGGRLRADADTSYANFLLSTDTYDLTGSHVTVELPTVPAATSGTEAYVEAYVDSNNSFGFLYAGGTANAFHRVAGSTTHTDPNWPAYNSTSQRWIRLREASGTVHIEASPDGTTGWTGVGPSFAAPFTLTAVHVRLGAANWNNVSNPGVAEFDNLNPAAEPPNEPPTVDVGADAVGTVGTEFTRTATATDPDGTITSYAWTIQSAPAGSTATLTGPTTATAGITPDVAGTYVLRCTVTDDDNATATDDLTLTAAEAPTGGDFTATWTMATANADTGGTGITGGTLNPVNLATFVPNVTAYAYTGSPVLQFSSTALDMAAAVANGSYVEIPLVPDAGVTSWTPTSLALNIARGGSASPRGFQIRYPGNAYATDLPGGGDVTTQRTTWSARTIDLTPMGTVTGTQILRMYIYMPLVNSVPGTLETDSWVATGTYTAGAGNIPPTVNAGTDTSATVGTALTRTATATDTDGTIASYQWAFTTKPGTSTAALTGATTATVTFTPDTPGTYTLACTVTDDDGATDTDAFTVSVVAAGGGTAAPPAGWFLRMRGDDVVGSDGDPVASWADTAGTTAFAQGNSSKRPYVSAGTLNGHDGVGFDAGDDALTAEPWVLDALRNRGGGTLGVVSRRMVVAAGTQSVLSFANGTSEALVRGTVQRVDDAYRFAGRRLDSDSFQSTLQTAGVATDEGVARATTAVYDWAAAAGRLYRDGSLIVDEPAFQTAGATSDTASVQAAIGSGPDRVSDFASVVVYEVVVWPWALSAGERAQWHTYVQDTYGITVSDYTTPATLTLAWGTPIA